MNKHMKKYQTDEERKAAKAESDRKYYNTQYGRALHLLSTYRRMDRRNGFGDCIDFDAKWIVENIFTQKCAHCDETDWHKLGCNRIDNSKPHTKDNVEPCCKKCNDELAKPYFAEKLGIPIAQHVKNSGELVAVWKNASEAARQLGYAKTHINECCIGKCSQAYGFVWYKISKEQYETLKMGSISSYSPLTSFSEIPKL